MCMQGLLFVLLQDHVASLFGWCALGNVYWAIMSTKDKIAAAISAEDAQ